MKVIGIRGTNGAGKSWVARQVMSHAEPGFKTKHKLSNGVLLNVYDKFVIIGSYDRACGGCDTVKTPQLVWDTIVECAPHSNVLFEGVIVGNVYEPTMLLHHRLLEIGAEYIPVCLDVPLEHCIENVNSRRAIESKGEIEKTVNIETNYKKHVSSCKKLHAAGLNPRWVSPDAAVALILEELGYAES